MTQALIITAKPGGGLTYEGNDVVQVLDGAAHPGDEVTPTSSGFLFVYVSDRDATDDDVAMLMCPQMSPQDPDDPPVELAKRRYQVTLSGSEFETWVPASDAVAAGIVKTWAEVQAITTDKEA